MWAVGEQTTMAKHLSFKKARTGSMPSLESISTSDVVVEESLSEREKFRVSSVLASIEIASCFRSDKEPLFQLLSPIIYSIPDL